MGLRGGLLALAGAVWLAAHPAVAQDRTDFADRFEALLAEGRTSAAADFAREALAAAPGDGQARFALGAAQFLLSVEHLGQGLYRYGLKSDYDTGFGGLTDLPFLRLPVPPNADPEQVTYDGLRVVLEGFLSDLAVAGETLAGVGPEAFDLPLDLARIRLDFDGDGKGSEREGLLYSFRAVSARATSDTGFMVDFDQSDAPWLRGYCHLLSAMANFPLALDWEAAFNQTFHSLFPDSDLPSSELHRNVATTSAMLEGFRDEHGKFPSFPHAPPSPPRGDMTWREYQRSDAYQEYIRSDAYREYQRAMSIYREYRALKEGLWYASIADLVAFIHLFDWPVVEPERMGAVRVHLLKMIALSRENWTRIQAETDDKREWVPGPKQSGIFQSVRVDAATVAGWHTFLDEFEAILEGSRLIKHWRFPATGINVRRMLEEPRAFDPVLILTGSAAIPYLEEGDLVTGDTAETMFDLFGGDFFAYFIWFN